VILTGPAEVGNVCIWSAAFASAASAKIKVQAAQTEIRIAFIITLSKSSRCHPERSVNA